METNQPKIPQGYKATSLGLIPQEWEVKRLGEICSYFKSGEGITSKDISETGQYPVYGGNGLRGYTDKKYTHDGAYILIGRQGALCGNINYVTGKCYISEHAIAVQAKGDLVWLRYKLDFWNLNRYSESSAQPGLAVEKLVRYKLSVPPISEQRKIAEVLGVWDEAISMQSRLVDKLAQRKRGLMQRLLTAQLRLPGFSEPWKKVKLGDIARIKKGEQVNKDVLFSNAKYPVINGGITPSGFLDIYNTKANTITISEGGNSCGYVNFITTPFWSGGHCYTINTKDEINNLFIYHLLKNHEKYIMSLRVGSGLPNIQIKNLENLIFVLPSYQEQTAIAEVLTAADREIELAKEKLERLRQQKRGLMQQLLTGKKRIKY